jgi:hypothetical protein
MGTSLHLTSETSVLREVEGTRRLGRRHKQLKEKRR